jgi:DNA repair protein RadC
LSNGGDETEINQVERRASETREDHQETPAERTFSNHQGQDNFYHKEPDQVKVNALLHRNRLKDIQVVKVMLVRDSGNQCRTKKIKRGADAASVIREFLAGEDREVFLAICLDGSGRINSINIVSIGCLTAGIVHPREVFKPAILSNADSIVIAHNHPSGNPTPSEDDLKITRQLFKAGKLLGININEHIIIGEDEYTGISPDGEDIFIDTNKFKD